MRPSPPRPTHFRLPRRPRRVPPDAYQNPFSPWALYLDKHQQRPSVVSMRRSRFLVRSPTDGTASPRGRCQCRRSYSLPSFSRSWECRRFTTRFHSLGLTCWVCNGHSREKPITYHLLSHEHREHGPALDRIELDLSWVSKPRPGDRLARFLHVEADQLRSLVEGVNDLPNLARFLSLGDRGIDARRPPCGLEGIENLLDSGAAGHDPHSTDNLAAPPQFTAVGVPHGMLRGNRGRVFLTIPGEPCCSRGGPESLALGQLQ